MWHGVMDWRPFLDLKDFYSSKEELEALGSYYLHEFSVIAVDYDKKLLQP